MTDTPQAQWPQSYYKEKDPQIRKQLLEQAIKDSPQDKVNELRRKLWELRYQSKDKKNVKQAVDYYIAGWMELLYLSRSSKGFFGLRHTLKSLDKILQDMGFSIAGEYGEMGQEVLYQELHHLCCLYFELCISDRNYGSQMMGLMSMKEEAVIAKIAAETAQISNRLPRAAKRETQMEVLSRAARQAFYDMFPKEKDMLTQAIEKV